MTEFSGHPDHEFPNYHVEKKNTPGIVAALIHQVNDARGRWAEHAGPKGDITLSTFDGVSVEIDASVLKNGKQSPLPPGSQPSGGMRLFRRVDPTDANRYSVELTEGDKHTVLTATTRHTSGATSVEGKSRIETSDGPVETQLRSGVDLEEAIEKAAHSIDNGFPLSEEAAIAERQNRPCDEIVGNEAVKVQKVVEGVLTDLTDRGDDAHGQLCRFAVELPQLDSPWAISGVTVTSLDEQPRKGTGRSVTTYINFLNEENSIDSHPIGSPLVVRVEGNYDDSDRLISSRVKYSTERRETLPPSNNGDSSTSHRTYPTSSLSVSVPPSEREEIYAAIVAQVVPENLTLTHTS